MKISGYIIILTVAFMLYGCGGNRNETGPGPAAGDTEGTTIGMAEISFENTEYDFGKIAEGEKVGCIFKYENKGQGNLIIQKATGSCGCTVPRWSTEPVAPGESGQLEVIFDSSGRRGKQNKSVTVTSNSMNKVTILKITADIISSDV